MISSIISYNVGTACKFLQYKISYSEKEIIYGIENNDVLLLTAQTGSGKTTQIPQFLIQAGYTIGNKKIGVVLPRKIAAITIAKRVADELGCFNCEVAHKVRFNSIVNDNTRVVFMTDGTLVQELYSSPLLDQYSVIVLDDIHERTISYDILFSFLKRILQLRKDLKIVITSATVDTNSIVSFFQLNKDYKNQERSLKIKTINITGRLHQVAIHYLKEPSKNYFLKIFQTIVYIDREKQVGSVLVFLPSVEQLEGMAQMLDSYMVENKRRLKVMLLHSKVNTQAQNDIFQRSYDRKVILSTNIAESSITIPDVKFVIDCGYVKVKMFDWEAGIDKMIVVPCGRSSANQRAGRAGRVEDGQCFRVYTESGFKNMPERLPPQILRVDLSSFILKLKGLGIQDVVAFDMLQKPEEKQLAKAIDILFAYELVNDHFELTDKGKKVAEFSLELRNACMLMNSFEPRFGCSKEILMLVSMLQVQTELFGGHGLAILKAKKKVGAKQGDFITLINFFLRFHHGNQGDRKRICGQYKLRMTTMEQAVKIHDELLAQIKRFNRFKSEEQEMEFKFGDSSKKQYELKSSMDEHEAILRCIFTGYFTNIAQIQGDGSYLNIRSKQKLVLHSTSIASVVYPEWVIYHQIIKSSAFYIHNVSQIYPQWIFELAGNYYLDKRKDQATNSYSKQLETIREQTVMRVQEKPLVHLGFAKKKPEGFNTAVIGFKKMKRGSLSFQQQI